MIRKLLSDIIRDLTNAVARSELASENARLRSEAARDNATALAALGDWEKQCDDLRAKMQELESANERLSAQIQELTYDDRDELRARLEATERERDEALANAKAAEDLAEQRRQETKEAKAERRSPVDRSAAIEAANRAVASSRWGGSLNQELTRAIVDAILGAQKEAPAEKPATVADKKGVRAAIEMAAKLFGGNDGVFNMCGLSSALMNLAGLNGQVDGILCRTILADRDDVESCEPGNPKCAHYRIKKSAAFVPAETSEEPSADTLARIRTIITSSSSPTDAAPRIYGLFAADHAAAVKRIEELKSAVNTTRLDLESVADTLGLDRSSSVVGIVRKARELLTGAAPFKCPADGMSDYEVGRALNAAAEKYPTQSGNAWEAMGTKARELFARAAK